MDGQKTLTREGDNTRSARTMRKRRTYGNRRSSSAYTRRSSHQLSGSHQGKQNVYEASSKNLRIIPLGGCEEVGRNMTVFEYDGDVVILDMGIQFPEEDMPGIDYIIPNAKYLMGKEKNIRGVIFSHGHLDHIGAAPILLEKLGNPIIIGRNLTLALIKRKLEDYKKGMAKSLKTIQVKSVGDRIQLGKFTVKFFQVEHSI